MGWSEVQKGTFHSVAPKGGPAIELDKRGVQEGKGEETKAEGNVHLVYKEVAGGEKKKKAKGGGGGNDLGRKASQPFFKANKHVSTVVLAFFRKPHEESLLGWGNREEEQNKQ